MGDDSLPVYEFTWTGSFNSDASAMEGVVSTALVDLGDFTLSGSPICDYLALFFSTDCEACPGDGDENCLPLELHIDTAPLVPGVTIDPDIDWENNTCG